MRKAIECVLLLAVITGAAPAGGQPTAAAGQRTFRSANAKMDQPVDLPPEVFAALQKDEAVRSALAQAKLSAAQLPGGWFAASLIHTEGSTALLVVEAERPLYDEYETRFWIFDRTENGYVLVLDDLGRELEVGAQGEHPGIRITREHYRIYPSTSYRWKDGHYAAVIVK